MLRIIYKILSMSKRELELSQEEIDLLAWSTKKAKSTRMEMEGNTDEVMGELVENNVRAESEPEGNNTRILYRLLRINGNHNENVT